MPSEIRRAGEIHDDESIGIPSAVLTDQQTAVASGRIRSIDVVKELIEAAEDEVS